MALQTHSFHQMYKGFSRIWVFKLRRILSLNPGHCLLRQTIAEFHVFTSSYRYAY